MILILGLNSSFLVFLVCVVISIEFLFFFGILNILFVKVDNRYILFVWLIVNIK